MVLLIADTTYKRGGAGPLVQYIQWDGGDRVPVKDHTGRDLDREGIQEFVEESTRHGMERHVILAPDPEARYSVSEVDRGTRDVMREWRSGRWNTRYVYAVHDSKATPHAHAVMTGPERLLRMDKQDLQKLHTLACEAFAERERLARRQARPTATAEATAEPAKMADREPAADPTPAADHELATDHASEPSIDGDRERAQKLPASEVDPSPAPERDIDWGAAFDG